MPTIWRSSTFSTFASTTSTESTNASTIGLGMMSGRAILALGEAAIRTAQRIFPRREPRESTSGLIKSRSRTSFISVSDYADTASTSSTVPGPGEISGRAIKALGEITLRGLDEIQLRLSGLDRLFPHENWVFWESDDGEQMYEDLIDLTRPGAFLFPILTHMQDRLVVLSLKVPPDMLHSLAPIALPQLQQLEVNVCTLGMPSREIDEVFDSFTVFVNNLYPTLKSLSISSFLPSQFLAFTWLFTNLGFFPRLDTFRFSIPFDGAHLSSPTILSKFLTKHRKTLRHLQLSTSRCPVPDTAPDPKPKYWIPSILASLDTPCPQLHELHLALRPLRADLSPVTDFLHKHARNLQSLTFTDRHLTYQEVQIILGSIIDSISETCSLRQLHLHVRHLSPALLDLLASRLPRLAHLELLFSEVVATAAYINANYPAQSREAELQSFKAEVLARRANYAQWELWSIGIPQGPSACLWLADLERLFVKCIPGVQFKELPSPFPWGNPHYQIGPWPRIMPV